MKNIGITILATVAVCAFVWFIWFRNTTTTAVITVPAAPTVSVATTPASAVAPAAPAPQDDDTKQQLADLKQQNADLNAKLDKLTDALTAPKAPTLPTAPVTVVKPCPSTQTASMMDGPGVVSTDASPTCNQPTTSVDTTQTTNQDDGAEAESGIVVSSNGTKFNRYEHPWIRMNKDTGKYYYLGKLNSQGSPVERVKSDKHFPGTVDPAIYLGDLPAWYVNKLHTIVPLADQ